MLFICPLFSRMDKNSFSVFIPDFDFCAQQRVTDENAEKMGFLFASNNQKYYQNNVVSFIGINASGKTSLLKLIPMYDTYMALKNSL